MKIRILSGRSLMLSLAVAQGGDKFTLDDFKISLNQITSAPQHVWVNSGYSTVQPQPLTVMGVNEFYSPPFAARNFHLGVDVIADTFLIRDAGSFGKGDVGLLYAGGAWYPHQIVRSGTYHHLKNGRLLSLAVHSSLMPLFGQSGFMLKVVITNRGAQAVTLKLLPNLAPGHPTFLPLDKWSYGQPPADTLEVLAVSAAVWKTGRTMLRLYQEEGEPMLDPGGSSISYFIVTMDSTDSQPAPGRAARQLEQQIADAWARRLAFYTRNIPYLESDIEGLQSYYLRSLLSGLVCIWENPHFKVNPHLTTSGMDGGATCSYLWDTAGYAPNLVTCMLDTAVLAIARQMVNIDLEKFYAFSPGGGGVGVRYAYSPSVFTGLVSSIHKFLGADELLFAAARRLILNDEKNQDKNTGLIDYGLQKNLLEMRSAGWEHFVVSPNAERVWCLNELAEMGGLHRQSLKDIKIWRQEADRIKHAIRAQLWDDQALWWKSVYPNGFTDRVYSIQAFDALPTGVCDSAMTEAMISHLRPGAFLGEFGVSSISAEDERHYEVLDTDWSGGGAFTGDGPQLALILYKQGRSEIAWQVLKRHFWMGKRFIYYPQEHYCDKPSSPPHKRANVIAGLCGAEAVLFGLVGLEPDYQSRLWIDPHLTVTGHIMIKDFQYHNIKFDVEMTPDHLRVTRNFELFYDGPPKRIRIL
jgi:hypothetical protein